MTELTQEELNNGKKVLGGVTIFFWVLSVIIGIGLFSLNFGAWAQEIYIGPVAIGFPAPNTSWIFLALYVVFKNNFLIRLNRILLKIFYCIIMNLIYNLLLVFMLYLKISKDFKSNIIKVKYSN